ncbi:MAG TPA: Abi family protein [Thermoanaerobacterales bacterium]|nr:Abi family protein [Thermoanaerobacterales bacterium]
MRSVKPFLSINEQIKLLKNRGLSITDSQYNCAEQFLLNNNYYRISGYSLTLRKNNTFFNSASLKTLMQIYEADRHMRHIILSIVETVETRIKSMVAYYHSEKYGPLGYLDINNFICLKNNKVDLQTVSNYLQITRKAERQKDSLKESELFIKHHTENKEDILPFWVYVEILTMSDISKLYTLLDDALQKKIAQLLGFKSSNNNYIVGNLLHCISILRNICAHGGRLYNRLFTRKPRLSKKEKSLLRRENGNIVFDKLFSYVLILKSIALPQDFMRVTKDIDLLHKQYPLVDFRHYGFPDNWRETL